LGYQSSSSCEGACSSLKPEIHLKVFQIKEKFFVSTKNEYTYPKSTYLAQ